MATYRLIRILRAVLPIIVVILIGIPARNYWISRNLASPAPVKTAPPPADFAVHTLDLKFTRADGGRILFHFDAKEHFMLKDNTEKLRAVEVVIAGEKPGDFDRVIKGDECIVNPQTKDIHFTGNVSAQLDATTSATTQELIYNHSSRLITSPVRTHVEQPGEMKGDADHLDYAMATELLTLTGNVGMQMSNGEALSTGTGEFHKKENWATVSGGVHLEAKNGWLQGNTGRAELQPGTYRPSIVTIDGDVSSESHGSTTPYTLTTHSKNLVSVLSPAGDIQRVVAHGDVSAEHKTKEETRTITGDEVTAVMNEHRVENMEARRAAPPFAKMVTSGRSLTSDVIRISDIVRTKADGSEATSSRTTTAESSELVANDSTITGKGFEITQTPDSLKFDSIFPAKLKSAKRTTTGDKTHAEFNSKTNALESLTQTGKFTFEEGARKGSADSAVITDGGNKSDLTGHFKFNEGTRSGSADHAVITNNGDTIDMTGAVKFADGARHGSAGHANFSNGGDSVQLQTSAIVIDDDKKSEVHGQAINFNQKTNDFDAKGNVLTISSSDKEKTVVTANHASGTGDALAYEGNVVLTRSDGTEIKAESIKPDKNNGFTAVGKPGVRVYSQMQGLQAYADQLDYNDEKKTAVYTGNVDATKAATKTDKNSMKLTAAVMRVVLNPTDAVPAKPAASKTEKSQLKELQADGRVTVTQGARIGKGDHLVYEYESDEMTLKSNPGAPKATVDDPPQKFDGEVIEWKSSGGQIRATNPSGGKSTVQGKAK